MSGDSTHSVSGAATVIFPIVPNGTPFLILPKDPLRIRAFLLTDCAFLFIAETAAKAAPLTGHLLAFGYTALQPQILETQGEVWGFSYSATVGDPSQNAIRMWVERRSGV